MKQLIIFLVCILFAGTGFAGESSKLPKSIKTKASEFVKSKSGAAFVKKYLVLNEKNSKPITGAFEVHYDLKGPGGIMSRDAVVLIMDSTGRVINAADQFPGLPQPKASTAYKVTEKQVIGIAARAGLEQGVKPWRISFKWRQEAGNYVWVVTSTLQSGEGSNGPTGSGKEMLIDAVSGSVLLTQPWAVR